MNEVMQCLTTRRSCRKFLAKQLEEADLAQILQAGIYAPSGRNLQAAKIIVLQKQEDIKQLERMNAAILGAPEATPFFGAPTVLVVLSNPEVNTCVEDGALVLGNMMNAAHSLGVGSCWIHRAREEFASEEGKALLQKWGISGNWIGIGHCILGYPDGPAPEAAPRKADYVVRV